MTGSRDGLRAELVAERNEALALLTHARAALDVVDPPELRAHLAGYLAAQAEQVRAYPHLLGLPVRYSLGMAAVIVAEHVRRTGGKVVDGGGESAGADDVQP